MIEPVVLNSDRLFGYTPYLDGRFGAPEGVVAESDVGSRDVGSILPVSAPVHVEAMAE